MLKLIGACPPIVREGPGIPVGETANLTNVLLTKRNGRGVAVDGSERGARDIIEDSRTYEGRIDRTYLCIGSVGDGEAREYPIIYTAPQNGGGYHIKFIVSRVRLRDMMANTRLVSSLMSVLFFWKEIQ